MRSGSGILQGLVTTTAHHVSDLDRHLRGMQAANAELRDRIGSVRAELAQADRERVRRTEVQRSIGAKVLAVELEIEQARTEASDYLAAVDEAADEDVRRILADGRAEAEALRRGLEVVVGRAEPGNVLPLPQLAVADAGNPSARERSVAM